MYTDLGKYIQQYAIEKKVISRIKIGLKVNFKLFILKKGQSCNLIYLTSHQVLNVFELF